MATISSAPSARRAMLSDRRARLESSPLRHLDALLIAAVIGTAALGMLMVYSATRNTVRGDPLYYVRRQGVFVFVGVLLMVAVMAVDYRKLRDLSVVVYAGLILGLLAVLSPVGSRSKGTQGWFQLPGGFQLQPSEFAKFALVIAVAGYCYQHRGDLDAWRLTVAVSLAIVPIGLVMLQPDLGTAMVMGLIVIAILAVAGLHARQLIVLLALAATGIFAVVNLGVLQQYQVDRLTSFLNQGGDKKRATYNVDQSKTAVANGQLTGRGLFHGTQTQLGFVPEQRTDFIFTVVGEELGFLGGTTLLALFAIIVWRTWRTARLAGDFFGTLVCVGFLAMFTFQIFENVGMTMGIMPITGLPLPFMSYGGSSVIAYFACIGLIASIHMRRFA
jgi:rod shape determining protein RodA